MSGNRDTGSGQPGKSKTKTRSMSHQSDTLHKPCGQAKGQSPHPQVMELILHLRQTIEDYITQLEARHL